MLVLNKLNFLSSHRFRQVVKTRWKWWGSKRDL